MLPQREGDLSIEWWREAHREFFSRECEALGIPFSEDCELVLEHFRLVYSE
ncbi:MAG: ASCH domain-containing protein [Endozoicomonas sp.]|uniref:ASCH domain-containing protein n=1 Tax=Endozoicomonas sp. TaxID=1892382 RepID=UPI003D9BD1A9